MKSCFIKSGTDSTSVELREVPVPEPRAGEILAPAIDRVFPFAELPQAKAHMEASAHLGKIILRI